MIVDAKTAIVRTLVIQEPCTLEELVRGVWRHCGCDPRQAVPITIKAIAAIIATDQICGYDATDHGLCEYDATLTELDDPPVLMDYAWCLSDNRFK